MHQRTLTVYHYNSTPFHDFSPLRPAGMNFVQLELPPELVRLIETRSPTLIFFSGDINRDSRVWATMKGGLDEFDWFFEATKDTPTIILVPDWIPGFCERYFAPYNIRMNYYGRRVELHKKLCLLRVPEEVWPITCRILETPSCVN